MNQSEISKIENRTDVYVSTLASYVEAMGGKLGIRAVFPDGGAVKINRFEALSVKPSAEPLSSTSRNVRASSK